VRRFYQLKNNNWWVFVLYGIQYFDSYNLIKKFVWCILLKANQIQNEQALQWLGSCYLIGGSRVQLPFVPFFKTWFKLKAKKKKKREEPVQPITRPSHRFLPSLTGFDRFSPSQLHGRSEGMLEPVYPPVPGSADPTGQFEQSFKTMLFSLSNSKNKGST